MNNRKMFPALKSNAAAGFKGPVKIELLKTAAGSTVSFGKKKKKKKKKEELRCCIGGEWGKRLFGVINGDEWAG